MVGSDSPVSRIAIQEGLNLWGSQVALRQDLSRLYIEDPGLLCVLPVFLRSSTKFSN